MLENSKVGLAEDLMLTKPRFEESEIERFSIVDKAVEDVHARRKLRC